MRNTRDGCIPVRVKIDEAALKARLDEWATTSSGSTHTSDYTWTDRTNSRNSEEDLASSEGSVGTAEYTEEDNVSVTESMISENVPAWHALKMSDTDEETIDESDQRGGKEESTMPTSPKQRGGVRKLIRAYLLNE